MKKCNQMKRALNFTLIELLVVIAMIAILAAILLPALNSARERGRAIDCISMYKQLYHALNGYSEDNNEYIIKHQLKTDASAYIDYWGGYLGYLGYVAPSGTNSATNFNKVAKTYFVCSTATGLGTSGGYYSGYQVSYGKAINKCIATDPHKASKNFLLITAKKSIPANFRMSERPNTGIPMMMQMTAENSGHSFTAASPIFSFSTVMPLL